MPAPINLRIISDLPRLCGIWNEGDGQVKINLVKYPVRGNLLLKTIKVFFLSYRCHYLLINFSKDIFLLGFLKRLFPNNPCRFVSLDIFLPYPGHSLMAKIQKYMRVNCLKGIDLIMLYSKANERLSRLYRINPSKLKYIPFKINSYDYVTQREISDKGYIFSGGQSRRDFDTLIEAARHFPYPVKIVTPHQRHNVHGTTIDKSNVPPNVEIIHDDGTIESFVSYIADSRLVVIPLMANDFASTGTSVYLMAMAMKKCVVISSGPTTQGILTPYLAIIVPPEDPDAVVKAIVKAFNDLAYRKRMEQNGYKYALSLGDETTFFHSIVKTIRADYILNRWLEDRTKSTGKRKD
jgi:glycosyltransferase involved in cell wall biosynthesis